MSPRKCPQCDYPTKLESVTVRVYLKRTQTEFRYHVCKECRQVLLTFLEGSSERTTRGLFDHAGGLPTVS